MRRRDFMATGAAGAAGALITGGAMARQAPDYMPIVADRMTGGDYDPCYEEREITEPVMVCDDKGILNPQAIGWAREPLFTANLSGHWPRKKKWNFWNWIQDDFVFSVTIAHIDYLCFCTVSMIDFEKKKQWTKMGLAPFARSSKLMPENVEETIVFEAGGVRAALIHHGDHIKVDVKCRAGEDLSADFVIHKPEGHETLNIVVPWTRDRFQMNSKHNTLPTEGTVAVGSREYRMDPERCHGVQDFGRGMWPYRSYWNWGVASGMAGGVPIGVNVGSKWTTGTGSNENGICYDGVLYKIMEDLVWEYDMDNPDGNWRIRSECSDVIDMTLTPFYVSETVLSLGLIRTGGVCPFGLWNGVVRPGGKQVEIRDVVGWAEEFSHRW